MMRTLAIGMLALCLAASAGCSRSPRVTFYTLEPGASAQAPASPAVAPSGAVSVAVGPVTLPELVDRPQLVVRVAANRVEILESQRWAEPLGSGIPRVLAEDLGRLLGSNRVSSYQLRGGAAADYRVLLDLGRFEAVPGDAVSVQMEWTLRRAAGGIVQTGSFRVREPAPGEGFDPLVAAYGRALQGVALDLARAIRADAAGARVSTDLPLK